MWEIKWDFGLWEFAPLLGETQPQVSTGGASGARCWAPDVCVGPIDVYTQMSERRSTFAPLPCSTPTGHVPPMSDCS